MIVAYLAGITLLPALLRVLNPPGEKEPLGFRALAPIDRFTERHRVAIIAGTLVVVFGGLPLLYFLRFDFNPMNLRSPKTEASMPRASPYTTARPASPSSRARRLASFIPAADALRAPTTAIMGRSRMARWPRTATRGGASSIIRRRDG
jgi:uncharacterized membrane protein YdfJ with MMPL/SSD domain